MSLVSYARYVAITGDTTSASASAVEALQEAQDVLEETLRRPLEQAERTERMKILNVDGIATVYPSAVPITVAAGHTIAGHSLQGASPDSYPVIGPPTGHATVTYTGGFDPDETDPEAATFVPRTIQRDIAWAAHSILHPSLVSAVPVGARSVSLGDASITFDRAQSGGQRFGWSPSTLRWRRRFV